MKDIYILITNALIIALIGVSVIYLNTPWPLCAFLLIPFIHSLNIQANKRNKSD